MVNESMDMQQLLDEQDSSYQEIYKGTVVEGTVILEKEDAYYIDLKYKTDGYLPKSEVFDDEDIKELLFNRVRYAYNNALEYFESNFANEILRLQLQKGVEVLER